MRRRLARSLLKWIIFAGLGLAAYIGGLFLGEWQGEFYRQQEQVPQTPLFLEELQYDN